jgi:hypothetical protein
MFDGEGATIAEHGRRCGGRQGALARKRGLRQLMDRFSRPTRTYAREHARQNAVTTVARLSGNGRWVVSSGVLFLDNVAVRAAQRPASQ